MSFRKILKYPNSGLRKRSVDVKTGEDMTGVVGDLWDTLNVAGGAGLAAPQIGIHKRVIYVSCPDFRGEMINPIMHEPEDLCAVHEGCLSFPGISEMIQRHQKVSVTFSRLDGSTETVGLNGLSAQVVQHEIEHLDGKLMIDHFRRLKKDRIAKRVRKVITEAKSLSTLPEETEPTRVSKTAHLSKKELKRRRKRKKMNR